MTQEKEGKSELGHELFPGYRKIFYVVLFIAVLYLVIVMAAT